MALSRSVRKQVEEKSAAIDDFEDDMEEATFDSIDKLQALGINASDLTKLKAAGFHTVKSVLMTPSKFLLEIKGISEAKCEKLVDCAKKLTKTCFLTGGEVASLRQNVVQLTTGAQSLDDLLGGGIETMSITEIFGEFRTGKTQLATTLCVTSQLPFEMKGGNGKVIFIDTEGTFRPSRIREIATRFGLDPDDTLENILTCRCYNHEQQMMLPQLVAAKIVSDEQPYRLLIIDSVMALFRTEFSGRGELATRQQKLARHLSHLVKLAEEFNIAVVLVNQVTADPGSMFVADAKKPIGGHIMAHASTTRLYLRKGKGEQRICKIYDSPSLPESEAVFAITSGGIADI